MHLIMVYNLIILLLDAKLGVSLAIVTKYINGLLAKKYCHIFQLFLAFPCLRL